MTRPRWYLGAGSVVLAWLAAAILAASIALTRELPEWLLIHLLLLGAVSNAILVWSGRLPPAPLGREERPRGRDETARLVLFNVGAITVVVGMTLVDVPDLAWAIVIAGATVVGEVVIWHAVATIGRMRRVRPAGFDAAVGYYVAGAVFLPFGILIGVLLAPDDLTESLHAQLALAHVSLNLLGWLGLSTLGLLAAIRPRRVDGEAVAGLERSARGALPVLAGSVAVVAVGALLGSRPAAVVGLLGYLVGLAVLGFARARTTGLRAPSTYAAWSVLAALAWFVGSVVALGAMLSFAADWESAAEAADRLGAPLLVGFAAQVLIGVLCYAIPATSSGGPEATRRAVAVLDVALLPRLAALNAALVVALLPVPDQARVAMGIVVLAVLASFLPIAVTAVVVARRGDRSDRIDPVGRTGA